jgi:hypothetical protein
MLRQAGFAALLVLVLTSTVGAQDKPASAFAQTSADKPGVTGTTGTVEQPPVDVLRLPIDMSRIRRQLVRASVREERDGLNLRYVVDVFAPAPAIDLFWSAKGDPNFWRLPAPYGAPTHQEFINLNTPQQHRAPAADFGALFRWMADKAKK